MQIPIATYRIQFHRDFGFAELERILPYLKELGVRTIYASPIFQAVPGSHHGYDGTCPLVINPEIGTLEQLIGIKKKMRELGMTWLQDVVPNHMAFHQDNKWLWDVLEQGRHSIWAGFFDIDWDSPPEESRLMVPFLGKPLEMELADGALQLNWDGQRPMLKYADTFYPINENSLKLLRDYHEDVAQAVTLANADMDLLRQIVENQHYRLCHWTETDRQINYRRFFTINGLICINIQSATVFEQYHSLIKQLTFEGVFEGFRIDHIDGLYDPKGYLDALKQLTGNCYVVVEKILQEQEPLPSDWACAGTTGYDFLAIVNNLFTNKDAAGDFQSFYQKFTSQKISVQDQIWEKKAGILFDHMGGELDNLCRLWLDPEITEESQLTMEELKEALASFLIACPVYRYYSTSLPLENEEALAISGILKTALEKKPKLANAIEFLRKALLDTESCFKERSHRKIEHAFRRCMQFSGPLMAKGVEDTLMYTYNCFIGHNEVGDSPASFGYSIAEVHQLMIQRQKNWPASINATSTHDTKRGEDVRARLNVLSDLSDQWFYLVRYWRKINEQLKTDGKPDSNDEYFIYQTLAGVYPMPETEAHDLKDRLSEYFKKALREAKVHSNWSLPDEAYETATIVFAHRLLDPDHPFLESFLTFQRELADFGILNSLSQLILKFTLPGVPDLYQGSELWDLTLVDPDNRSPVDYQRRLHMLQESTDLNDSELVQLWNERYSGKIKIRLTQLLLSLRTQSQQLYQEGEYYPLKVEGRYADHVFAFARRFGRSWNLIAIPLHVAQICKKQNKSPQDIDWRNTRIQLRPEMPQTFRNLLTHEHGKTQKEIFLKQLFTPLPFAILSFEEEHKERGAGILLPLASLPGPYGIGDVGPSALSFIRFLGGAGQKYWQLLPLNPTEPGAAHSPYSSYSSMAGNPLLISPGLLEAEKLLTADDLKLHHKPSEGEIDYPGAAKSKTALLNLAFQNFRQQPSGEMQDQFLDYCRKESYWLDDVALFGALKTHHNGKPWYEWPAEHKNRRQDAMHGIGIRYAEEIEKTKWIQFLFDRQWKLLRSKAKLYGIDLFGDMPFYVSYDSVDVWSHRELFSLDEEGKMTGVAGVPPDYFSETGQLWGMPTYNWEAIRSKDYDWWISRLKRNLALFDLLRIDHFRALQEYWEVPAGESTAINGQWLPGPGEAFFTMVRDQLGSLPFIAEDLGDNMEPVYKLRDHVGLPGMRVLQFAWGDNMPRSVDIPHNYSSNTIVYTGTHDNNTTVGWYSQESNRADHKRMHDYLGLKVRQRNIHEILARVAYASVARIAILPMQDILGLGAESRTNTPGRGEDNWLWRLREEQLSPGVKARLLAWVRTFNR